MKLSRRRLIAAIGAAVILILIIAIALLHTPAANRYALGLLQDLLRRDFGIELKASRARYNALRLSVRLEQVALGSIQAPDLPPIVQIERVDLQLSLPKLLAGIPAIAVARLNGLKLHYLVTEDGRSNLPRSQQDKPFEELPDFLIADLESHAGSLVFEDRRSQLKVNIPQWNLGLTGNALTLVHRLVFKSEPGSVAYRERLLPLETLEAAATLKKKGLELETLHLRSGNSEVSGSGSLDDFGKPALNLKIEPNLDLGQLTELAGTETTATGRVRGQTSVMGRLEDLQIVGKIEGDGIAAGGYEQVGFQAQVHWSSQTEQLRLDAFSARSPKGKVEGTGALALNPDGGSRLDARIQDLDLEPATRYFALPVLVASRASGTIRGQWKGLDISSMSADSRFSLAPTRPAPIANVLPITATGSVKSANDRIAVSIESGSLVGATVRGELVIRSRTQIEGSLRGHIERVEQLMADVGGYLGRAAGQPLAGVDLRGRADFTARVQGSVENPTVIGSLETPDLAIGGIEGANIKANAEITRSGVAVREAVAQLNGQELHANGFIGFEGSSPALKLDARIEQGSVAALLSALRVNLPAEGNFRGEAHLSGTLAHPAGEVALSGSELSLHGEPLGTLTAEIRIDGQKLETTRFLLEKTPGDATEDSLQGQGEYNIGSGQFSFEAAGKNLKIEKLTLPGETPLKGEFNLSASGTGTLDRPTVDLKLQATGIEVRQQLVGTVDATVTLRNQAAVLEIHAPRLSLAGNGRIETRAPYPAEFELKASDSDLSVLGIEIGPGQMLTGSIAATINGSGNLNAWKQAVLTAEIHTVRLAALDREVRNQNPIKLAYRDGVLKVDPAVIASNTGEIEVAGGVPLEEQAGRGSLTVKGHMDLAELFPFIPEPEGLYAAGKLNLDLSLEGTLTRLALTGGATLTEGFFHYPSIRMPVTDIVLDLKLENGILLLTQAQGAWGSGKLSLSGEMPLALVSSQLPFEFERSAKSARLALSLRDLHLESLGGEFPSGMTGIVDLQVSAEAPRLDLKSVTGKATFERLRLQMDEYVLEQAGPSTIVVQDGLARVERFILAGPKTKIQATGTAGLGADQPLDLRVEGDFDIGILTFMSDELRAIGDTQLRLTLAGTSSAPLFSGFLELKDGKANLVNPRIDADDLNVRLKFAPDSVGIEQLAGLINGGAMKGSGSVTYKEGTPGDFNIDLSIQNMFLDAPKGLKTVANADLKVRSPEDWIEIGGQVEILEGSFREPIQLDSELLNYLRADAIVDLGAEPSPLLSRVRYNVSLETKTPIIVDNNLAKLAAEANLKLVGTYYRPAVVGRMQVEEGGEIYLNERKYLVERGNIDFTSETRIEPSLDIQAKAEVSNYDIDLHVSGPPKKITTTLTSEPPLPEPDLISLLLTGRTLEAMHGEEFEVARDQVFSYLAGRAGQRISAGAQRALGFSMVRIEPSLITPESDPGARLTVGQDITRDFRTIYSMDLTDSGKQTWILEYNLTKRFTTRGVKDDDNDYRFEFDHEIRMGGPPDVIGIRAGSQPKSRIGSLKFAGDTIFPQKTLTDKLGVKPGDKYDFFKLQKGTDKLQTFYAKQGHLEALIRLERQPQNGQTDLTLQIQPGPQIEFVFEGAEVSGDVKDRVRQTWSEGAFDAQRSEDALIAIRKPLVEDGYLQSSVTYSVEELADRKRVRFSISPGARFTDVELAFTGASGIDASELKGQLKAAKLLDSVSTEPRQVADFLKRLYQKRGYLQAEVEAPRLEPGPQPGSGQMIIAIKEGSLFKVGDLNFSGHRHFSNERLLQAIPLATGKEYRSQLIEESLTALEQLYRTNGFNEVIISYRIARDPGAALANFSFEIEEHRQGVIREIVVEGNDRTSERFVRRQLSINQGELHDLDKIGRSRTNLYNTGAFSLVDFETEEIQQTETQSAPEIKPVRIRVKVSEVRPYRFRYGAYYDTDRGVGVITDLTNRNFLGKAAIVGASARYDSRLNDVRGYFSQPSIIGIPFRSNVTAFLTREINEAGDFITDRIGFTLQEQKRFKNHSLLEFGYRYERNRTSDREPDPLFPEPIILPLGRLFTTLTRDTRDDLLDATRGSFSSHGLEWAGEKLGSNFRFIKYYGQYFYYHALRKSDEAEQGLVRPRLVFASGVRAGLAKTFGGEFLIRPERFFAGGGTTVRGFEQDLLGPGDARGVALGGEAVFILNNELRFPLVSVFDGVGFVDLGNVYLKASDFNPFDLRKTAGFGLRLRTSFLLLRLDYGFKLDRKPVETRGAFFFSIGQAF